MSYAPETILEVRRFLQPLTNLSASGLGIVGDAAHARRASYHNGRDRVLAYNRLATDYSTRTARDRAGLTNAASALDIGNFPRLRTFSVWLVGQCRKDAPGTRDIREVIYSPDGVRVLRWDRQRGFASLPRTGEADNSHLWHTHISWYRDSEKRNKLNVLRAFFVKWGNDVPADIRRAYSAYSVASRLRRLGINYQNAVNLIDVESGCRKLGINFGTSIQLIDVRTFMERSR